MKTKNKYILVAIATLGFALTGCGAYETSNLKSPDSVGGGFGVGESLDSEMSKVEDQMSEVEASLANINSELSKISLFNLSASDSKQGLDKNIKKIFDKLVNGLTGLILKVDEVEAKIIAQLVKLDPANPLHVAAIEKLNQALDYLGRVKGLIDVQIENITKKVRDVIGKVDTQLSKVDRTLAIALGILWYPVKQVLLEQLDRLDNVVP